MPFSRRSRPFATRGLRFSSSNNARSGHRDDGRRVPRVMLAILNIDWQTLVDAVGLGAAYALMAVGIGLVFGVLRLVNFGYGQLVMAGAFSLALASQWGWAGLA